MPNNLKRTEKMEWSRFLSSPEGQAGIQLLRMSCPRPPAKTDADLIRNSVGFDFWMKAIDAIEHLGDVPSKVAPADDDQPLDQ